MTRRTRLPLVSVLSILCFVLLLERVVPPAPETISQRDLEAIETPTKAHTKAGVVGKAEVDEAEVKEAEVEPAEVEEAPKNHSDDIVVSFDQLVKGPVFMAPDNPKFIQMIREKYLHPPSTQAYNLTRPTKDPSQGQSKAIKEIFGDKKGFFIECGGLDGETRSNTLMFERDLGWKGALVEADPKNFHLMTQKRRKAWTVNACLSLNNYPNTVVFRQSFNIGKITELSTGRQRKGFVEVQCLPLYSVLLALNTTTVDYFSLDVEGLELQILKSIPWDKVNIKTLTVEFCHDEEGKAAIVRYMKTQGYTMHREITGGIAADFLFIKNDFLKTLNLNTN